MRLPLIKATVDFIQSYDEDYVIETMEVLEAIADSDALRDEEMDVIGELLSNFSGAIEVKKMIDQGTAPKEALNQFMKRVMGSIDR